MSLRPYLLQSFTTWTLQNSSKMKRTATAPKESEITKKTKKTKDFSKLTVNYTGIRDGETIVGVNYNQTDGVEMLIRATALYHPIDECPPNVIRDQFKRLAFFSKMTFEERKDYLAENLRAYKSGKENHLTTLSLSNLPKFNPNTL